MFRNPDGQSCHPPPDTAETAAAVSANTGIHPLPIPITDSYEIPLIIPLPSPSLTSISLLLFNPGHSPITYLVTPTFPISFPLIIPHVIPSVAEESRRHSLNTPKDNQTLQLKTFEGVRGNF